MYGIMVENGEKLKCPHCNTIYAIENDHEILYRNITLLHLEKKTRQIQCKCKNCKELIKFNS